MAERTAFTPLEEYQNPDSLGTIFVNDEGDFNVREAYEDGQGYIVTEDPTIIAALDRYPAVERVELKDAEAAQKKHAKAPAKAATGDDK